MNFPHILVITASAGSGKTYSLSERYISFLLAPDIKASSRHILAITFTNKAAGEMKGRIISSLKEIGLGDSGLRESALLALDELLDKYSDLRVQTIDSFLASATRSSALELGLPPHFEIALDPSPALNFVMDELLSQVYPVKSLNGVHQDSRGGPRRITRLFLGLLYELLRVDEETGWDIKKVILKNVGDLRKQRFLKGGELKRVFSYRDVQRRRDDLRKALRDFLRSGEGALDFKKSFVGAVSKFIKEEQYQPWESRMFLKGEVEELCKKNSRPLPEHQKAWEEIREALSSLAELTAHCRFAPFLNFIDLFEDDLQSFKNRSQIIFIEDLNIHLKKFLTEEGIVPEVYFHLGDRISHFFIDEFQDTSRLQWENLFPLIEETLSKGGSLFYVGDRKQAIYRFRGGESALFEKAKRSFPSIEGKSLEERFPETNYRSRENIVSFISRTFSVENLALWAQAVDLSEEVLDLSPLLGTYAHSAQKIDPKGERKGGLVWVERISPREPLKKEELDIATGKRLVDLIRNDITPRFPPRDIAILVRTNTEASWVTGVLTGAGLPVASEKTLDISSNGLIRELVSFLSFLDSPVDNFSFACFLSGDIFLKISALTRGEIFSFLLESRRGEGQLYTLFREKFPEVWQEHLEEYFQAVGFLPPYDLINRLLKKYKVLENFPDEEGFFYQFLEVLKQSEAEGGNNLKAFLDLWYSSEKKKENFQVVLPEYTNAIRVLTIHGAKGLGFPIVIIPFIYLNKAPIREVYERRDGDFVPYRINRKQAGISRKLKQLYREEFTSQLLDELNAFYVASTRAGDELYIFLPNYKNWAGKLPAPVLCEDPLLRIGSPLVRSVRVARKKRKHLHPPFVQEWPDKLCRPHTHAEELTAPVRKKAQERGVLIHNFLAGIGKLSENWEEELGSFFLSLREKEKEIIPLLKRFFHKESWRKWFVLPDDVRVFCEKEVIDSGGLRHQVDRLLVSAEEVTAIEFKCGQPHSREHREQVLTYLKLLSEIFPDRNVEGWLVYVDEMSQEKIINHEAHEGHEGNKK